MSRIGTYGFGKVVFLVDGVPLVGLADGDDIISVDRNKETFSLLIGGQGDAAAIYDSDRSGVATVKLLQTSTSNAILSAKYKIQEAGVLSPIPIAIKDTSGLDLVTGDAAFIVKPPAMAYGQGHNAREWSFVIPTLTIFAGGTV